MPFRFAEISGKIALFSFLFYLVACSAPPQLVKFETDLINVNVKDSTTEEVSVKQLIAPYKKDLEKEMNEALIISNSVFEKAQPEGELGNLIADIVFEKGIQRYRSAGFHQPDFCLINNGGLRVALSEGVITRGKIFELMPFENEIVIVTLTGEKTAELFDYLIKVNGQPISGLQLKNFNQPDFQALIQGTPFDKNKNYKVVTSDYLAGGGDKMEFFKNSVSLERTDYKIRDAIIDYLIEENQKGNVLKPHAGGRITNVQ